MAVSVRQNGGLVGVVGARAINGEIWLWSLLSADLLARPMLMHRRARRLLPQMWAGFGRKPLYASVALGERAIHGAWLERLGFKRIGLIKDHCGTGRKVWRYCFDGT